MTVPSRSPAGVTGRRLAAILVVALALTAACGSQDGATSPTEPTPPTGDLSVFATQFDAAVGHRRLVLLMSPT